MDKCLILWEPDPATGLWIEKVSFGILYGFCLHTVPFQTRLGVVGGPVASGFYGGLFGPYGTSVLGHTFQGGFHIWKANEVSHVVSDEIPRLILSFCRRNGVPLPHLAAISDRLRTFAGMSAVVICCRAALIKLRDSMPLGSGTGKR